MIKIFSRGEAPPPFFVGKCVAIRYYNYQTVLEYTQFSQTAKYVSLFEFKEGKIQRTNQSK